MRYLSLGAAVVASLAVIGPASAQVAPYGAPPPGGYAASPTQSAGLPPEDAYREGLINRWQLEQSVGQLPAALQGPAVNGNKGMQTGGGM